MAVEVPSYVDNKAKEKIENVLQLVYQNLPDGEQPQDIFVSNPQNGGGPTNISVWLFTQTCVVEIRNPHIDGRIQHDLAPFKDSVDWIRLDARRFKFGDPEPESELALEFTTADGLSGELLASGEGCSRLMEVYREKFLPNFTGPQLKNKASDSLSG